MARSKAYPAIDLREACALVVQKLGNLGIGTVGRDELAHRFGHETSDGGLAARKIGALVHYGFLERQGNASYSLSRLGAEVLETPLETTAGLQILKRALETPVMFSRLLGEYRAAGEMPRDVASVLVRDFEILDSASAEAASVFLRSAKYAQVLDARERFSSSDLGTDTSRETESIRHSVRVERGSQGPTQMVPEEVVTSGRGGWLKLQITGSETLELDAEELEAFEDLARRKVESTLRRLKLNAQARDVSSPGADTSRENAKTSERIIRGPRLVQ